MPHLLRLRISSVPAARLRNRGRRRAVPTVPETELPQKRAGCATSLAGPAVRAKRNRIEAARHDHRQSRSLASELESDPVRITARGKKSQAFHEIQIFASGRPLTANALRTCSGTSVFDAMPRRTSPSRRRPLPRRP